MSNTRGPAARFTEPAENFAHQHQDVRVENGQQFGDRLQFVDFAYTARVARVNVTRFTIPDLSKDNVQVGVRAVDRDGYRSPVAFPVPSA
jgi:hypothetical protein